MTSSLRPPARRDLWLTRGFYLFWFAGLGFLTPFITLFYLSLGMSGTQIGLVGTLGGLFTLLAAPVWAARHLHLDRPARTFQGLVLAYGVGALALSAAVGFTGVAVITSLRSIVGAGVPPLMDGMSLTVTRALGVGWGGVRLFGSIGWVVFVLLAGILVEQFGLPASLIGAGVLTLASAAMLAFITPAAFTVRTSAAPPTPRDVMAQFRATPRLLGVAAMIALVTLGAGGAYQYEGAFLKDLGATEFLIGVAGMLSALVEIPFMIVVDRLLRRTSPYRLMISGMLIYVGLRGVVFLFPSVGMIMAAAAGIGVAYSLLIVASTRFIADQAGEARTPMMLAFINVTLPGVISLFSSPTIGWFYDTLGVRSLYALAAACYLTAALVLVIAARWPQRASASAAVSG